MMREAPSSTPRMGRKESERYSKNVSIHGSLPLDLARAAALTSSLERPSDSPAFFIWGRAMIWS